MKRLYCWQSHQTITWDAYFRCQGHIASQNRLMNIFTTRHCYLFLRHASRTRSRFMVIDFSATVSGLRRSIESEEEAGVFHRDKYERARAVLIFLKFDASKWDRKYRLFYVMSVLDEYSPVGTFRRRGDDDRKQRALLALSPYNVSRGANSPPYPCASPL